MFVLAFQGLAERYGVLLHMPGSEIADTLEVIRVQALKRGQRNQTFRETNMATVELLLPRDRNKVHLCRHPSPLSSSYRPLGLKPLPINRGPL